MGKLYRRLWEASQGCPNNPPSWFLTLPFPSACDISSMLLRPPNSPILPYSSPLLHFHDALTLLRPLKPAPIPSHSHSVPPQLHLLTQNEFYLNAFALFLRHVLSRISLVLSHSHHEDVQCLQFHSSSPLSPLTSTEEYQEYYQELVNSILDRTNSHRSSPVILRLPSPSITSHLSLASPVQYYIVSHGNVMCVYEYSPPPDREYIFSDRFCSQNTSSLLDKDPQLHPSSPQIPHQSEEGRYLDYIVHFEANHSPVNTKSDPFIHFTSSLSSVRFICLLNALNFFDFLGFNYLTADGSLHRSFLPLRATDKDGDAVPPDYAKISLPEGDSLSQRFGSLPGISLLHILDYYTAYQDAIVEYRAEGTQINPNNLSNIQNGPNNTLTLEDFIYTRIMRPNDEILTTSAHNISKIARLWKKPSIQQLLGTSFFPSFFSRYSSIHRIIPQISCKNHPFFSIEGIDMQQDTVRTHKHSIFHKDGTGYLKTIPYLDSHDNDVITQSYINVRLAAPILLDDFISTNNLEIDQKSSTVDQFTSLHANDETYKHFFQHFPPNSPHFNVIKSILVHHTVIFKMFHLFTQISTFLSNQPNNVDIITEITATFASPYYIPNIFDDNEKIRTPQSHNHIFPPHNDIQLLQSIPQYASFILTLLDHVTLIKRLSTSIPSSNSPTTVPPFFRIPRLFLTDTVVYLNTLMVLFNVSCDINNILAHIMHNDNPTEICLVLDACETVYHDCDVKYHSYNNDSDMMTDDRYENKTTTREIKHETPTNDKQRTNNDINIVKLDSLHVFNDTVLCQHKYSQYAFTSILLSTMFILTTTELYHEDHINSLKINKNLEISNTFAENSLPIFLSHITKILTAQKPFISNTFLDHPYINPIPLCDVIFHLHTLLHSLNVSSSLRSLVTTISSHPYNYPLFPSEQHVEISLPILIAFSYSSADALPPIISIPTLNSYCIHNFPQKYQKSVNTVSNIGIIFDIAPDFPYIHIVTVEQTQDQQLSPYFELDDNVAGNHKNMHSFRVHTLLYGAYFSNVAYYGPAEASITAYASNGAVLINIDQNDDEGNDEMGDFSITNTAMPSKMCVFINTISQLVIPIDIYAPQCSPHSNPPHAAIQTISFYQHQPDITDIFLNQDAFPSFFPHFIQNNHKNGRFYSSQHENDYLYSDISVANIHSYHHTVHHDSWYQKQIASTKCNILQPAFLILSVIFFVQNNDNIDQNHNSILYNSKDMLERHYSFQKIYILHYSQLSSFLEFLHQYNHASEFSTLFEPLFLRKDFHNILHIPIPSTITNPNGNILSHIPFIIGPLVDSDQDQHQHPTNITQNLMIKPGSLFANNNALHNIFTTLAPSLKIPAMTLLQSINTLFLHQNTSISLNNQKIRTKILKVSPPCHHKLLPDHLTTLICTYHPTTPSKPHIPLTPSLSASSYPTHHVQFYFQHLSVMCTSGAHINTKVSNHLNISNVVTTNSFYGDNHRDTGRLSAPHTPPHRITCNHGAPHTPQKPSHNNNNSNFYQLNDNNTSNHPNARVRLTPSRLCRTPSVLHISKHNNQQDNHTTSDLHCLPTSSSPYCRFSEREASTSIHIGLIVDDSRLSGDKSNEILENMSNTTTHSETPIHPLINRHDSLYTQYDDGPANHPQLLQSQQYYNINTSHDHNYHNSPNNNKNRSIQISRSRLLYNNINSVGTTFFPTTPSSQSSSLHNYHNNQGNKVNKNASEIDFNFVNYDLLTSQSTDHDHIQHQVSNQHEISLNHHHINQNMKNDNTLFKLFDKSSLDHSNFVSHLVNDQLNLELLQSQLDNDNTGNENADNTAQNVGYDQIDDNYPHQVGDHIISINASQRSVDASMLYQFMTQMSQAYHISQNDVDAPGLIPTFMAEKVIGGTDRRVTENLTIRGKIRNSNNKRHNKTRNPYRRNGLVIISSTTTSMVSNEEIDSLNRADLHHYFKLLKQRYSSIRLKYSRFTHHLPSFTPRLQHQHISHHETLQQQQNNSISTILSPLALLHEMNSPTSISPKLGSIISVNHINVVVHDNYLHLSKLHAEGNENIDLQLPFYVHQYLLGDIVECDLELVFNHDSIFPFY